MKQKHPTTEKNANLRTLTLRLTMTALFMAMNIAMCTFSIPVPGGHLYLCDVVICTAAILLDPFSAFLVGGVGAFLGDLFFYPVAMFVSLFAHGTQALAVSLFAHYFPKKRPILASGIGVTVGAALSVIGYSLGRAFVYSTPEAAVVKLPYEILQTAIGAVLGMLLCWKFRVKEIFDRFLRV